MTAKKERLLNFIIIFSAAFTFLCYFFYLLGGTVLSDSGGLFVVLFVFLGTTLPIIFSKQIKKILKKAYPILKMIYCAGLCLYMICFLIFTGVIVFHNNTPITFDSRQTVLIVCGSKAYGYTPGDILESRLEKAYEILSSDSHALCIVSGGQGDDETISEAECMRAYLVKHGIDSSRIILEDRSRNTAENIKYSIEVMKNNSIPLDSNIICVSSDFHTQRVALVAVDNGLDIQCASAESPTAIRFLSCLVREFMSYIKYFIFR
ncbi:MAG: YdcF family protein [Ruminococcaceae bacterium]|nr:YdcF family protein [Oscillospiraceae bacterium]